MILTWFFEVRSYYMPTWNDASKLWKQCLVSEISCFFLKIATSLGRTSTSKRNFIQEGTWKSKGSGWMSGGELHVISASIGPCDHLSVNQISHVLWTNMKPTNVRLHPNVRLDADVEIHLNSQAMSQKESLATLEFPGSSHRGKLNFRR